MTNCVFCKIVKGKIPADKVKETEDFVVFKDIHPSAPTHLLIVPKKHVLDPTEVDDITWNGIRKIAIELQKELKLSEFQLLINAGNLADVKHLHAHFKAGMD